MCWAYFVVVMPLQILGVVLGIQTLIGWKVLLNSRQVYKPTPEQQDRAQQAEISRQGRQRMTFQQQVDWVRSHLETTTDRLLEEGADPNVVQVVLMALQEKHNPRIEQDGSDTD